MIIRFSENLKALRTEKKLNQHELAEVLNTTQRRISYFETGAIEPDLQTLWRLSEYFDVSVDFLIGKVNY